jgi:hypothetical protein
VLALDGIGIVFMLNHCAIGQITDPCVMAGKALGVEFCIEFGNPAASHKCLGFGAAAEKTGPVARCQSCYLIEKEERCVAPPHGIMVYVLVMQFAANPVGAGPAALPQCLVIRVKLSTAVSQHRAACRHGNNVTVWLNAVLQGHGWQSEL